MALADKFQDLMTKMAEMQGEVAELEKPAADSGVDMSKLQDQIKALGEERDKKAKEAADLRAAIQAEIDDQDADTKRLEKAIKPIEEVPVEAPVPEVPVQDQPSQGANGDQAQGSEAPAQGSVPGSEQGQAPGGPETNANQLTDITKG